MQVERELVPGFAAAVAYLGVRSKGLILSRNVNVPTAPAAAGVPNLGRPDPRYANVSRFESLGEARYDGLTVSLRRSFTGAVSARVSYTLSNAEDNAGNAFFFSPQDNADIDGEWGPSDNDQRHRLVVSASLDAPSPGPRPPPRMADGRRLQLRIGAPRTTCWRAPTATSTPT